MNNRYKYRHYLDDVQIDPITPKSTSKVYEREEKRVFHRERLNGDQQLLRGDFSKIDTATIDHEFDYLMERGVDGVYTPYITGVTNKTDCPRIDEDRKISKFHVRSIDRYEKLFAAYDKEFDVVRDLQPPIHRVNYKKQALIQLAFPGHTNLFNIISGNVFAIEGSGALDGDLISFGFVQKAVRQMYIPGTADMTPDVSGVYDEDTASGSEIERWVRTDGLYRIVAFDGSGIHVGEVQVRIVRVADVEDVYTTDWFVSGAAHPFFETDDISFEGTNTLEAVTTDSECRAFLVTPFIRVLTDKENVFTFPTLPVPDPDIGPFGYLYYVDPSETDVSLLFFVSPTDLHTTAPTQYNKFFDDALHFAGEYFVAPPPLATKAYPVLNISWREYALWGYYVPILMDLLIADASVDKVCRNAYKLQDVIKYMLAEIDTNVSYNSTTAHSRFLNNTTNPVSGDDNTFVHFITPKSNIIIGDYDNPATRGLLKFADIDRLLLSANLHWWIDNTGMFHIEHIHYYNNGRSYTTQILGADLTTQKEPRLDKYWAYHTNNYRYKKEEMPERFEFGWMDVTSDPFNGYPINMLSNFVQKGNTEDKRVTGFTSDIDYGQAFPGNMSKDGFYIMATTLQGSDYVVQFEELAVTGLDALTLQNGFWSFWFLHEKFHRHNLPCSAINLNNQDTTATTVKRNREQEILIASPIEPDTMRLVRTSIGICEIVGMDVNLESRANKILVLADNE